MRIYSKHAEMQTTVVKADFSGGLNTEASVNEIAENQLAEVVNMELDVATGRLKTVAGTSDILRTENIFAVIYDSVNELMLVVKNDRQVYLADFEGNVGSESVGKLSGSLYPKYAAWNNGVLIASGDRLQYFDGATLSTTDSPIADEVFVRNGRIVVVHGSTFKYSGVGDVNDWREDNNRENASKFVEVNYKEGSRIIGVVPLSQDILFINNDRKAFRLGGEYPQWTVAEVAKQIECSGRRSLCAVGDDVFVLGNNEASIIQNSYYGNVKPEDVAMQVHSEIHRLPRDAQVKYLSSLWQVWCIGKGGFVFVYDVRLKSWIKRQFNAEVIDVFEVGNEVYIVKADRVSKLDNGTFKDNGEWLHWRFLSQRLVSHHEYLLKRSTVSVTPLNGERYSGHINCGKVVIPLPIPQLQLEVQGSDNPIYRNKTQVERYGRIRGYRLPQPPNEKIFDSAERLSENPHKLFTQDIFVIECRNVFRSKYLDVSGQGTGGRFILHSIVLDIAEV